MSFFRRGIHILPEKWEKVVSSDGQYFHCNVSFLIFEIKFSFCKETARTYSRTNYFKQRTPHRWLSTSLYTVKSASFPRVRHWIRRNISSKRSRYSRELVKYNQTHARGNRSRTLARLDSSFTSRKSPGAGQLVDVGGGHRLLASTAISKRDTSEGRRAAGGDEEVEEDDAKTQNSSISSEGRARFRAVAPRARSGAGRRPICLFINRYARVMRF